MTITIDKQQTLPTRDMVDDLLDYTRQAMACPDCDGVDWYVTKSNEIRQVAASVGIPFVQAVAVYAVLSANASVEENDRNFMRVMLGHKSKGFGDRQRRAELALAGDIEAALTYINGEKVPSFFDNLLDPYGSVAGTVDRHAGDIITGDRRVTKNTLALGNRRGYRILEDTYKAVGAILGMRTNSVQAIGWVHWIYCA